MLTKLTDLSLKLRKDYKRLPVCYLDWMKDFLTCDFKNLMIYICNIVLVLSGNYIVQL